MKTTIHLHRPATPVAAPTGRSSTIRLGLLVSVFAAVAAVLVSLFTDVPAVAVLIPVVVIGSTLSWHTSGHDDSAPPP